MSRVHPFGIVKLSIIFLKVVALATRVDLEDICGIDQLCSGLQAGMEGTIHAVCELLMHTVIVTSESKPA